MKTLITGAAGFIGSAVLRHRSIEKAKRFLGFKPRPVEEALRDAVEWFREHGYFR